MKKTPICFASDANFIEQLRTASFSAVYACRDGGPGLDVHILDCGINDEVWTRYERELMEFAGRFRVSVSLVRHAIDLGAFSAYPTWTNGSRAIWARLLLPDILPDEDVCVYSDCDMLFVENPAAIVEPMVQSDVLMTGHHNPFSANGPDAIWFARNKLAYEADRYLCSGLIGLNLEELRKASFVSAVFDFLKRYPKPVSVDQTILNWFCHGRTEVLDDGWGLFLHEVMSYEGQPKAIHYSGGYPWSQVKNAYDWVSRHCSRRATELINDFRVRIMGSEPFGRASAPRKDVVLGWGILTVTRILNFLRLPLPGHPCFSELVRAFDGSGVAIERARSRLMDVGYDS